jgi:hypothetical protein
LEQRNGKLQASVGRDLRRPGDAAGGEQVLQGANRILTAAVDTGAVDDPYARAALRALVHSTSLTLDEGICGVTNRNGLLRN